jgi:hypothetical protein
MTRLVKCKKSECYNITKDDFNQYGSYCFKHSMLTSPPKKLNPKSTVSLFSDTFTVFSDKTQMSKFHSKTVKHTSHIRRAPLRKSNDVNEFDTAVCCVLEELVPVSYLMNCGHVVCSSCLDLVRSLKCPVCKEIMEGPLISEEIAEEILAHEREDQQKINRMKPVYTLSSDL